jgi:hypothetical protein
MWIVRRWDEEAYKWIPVFEHEDFQEAEKWAKSCEFKEVSFIKDHGPEDT